MNNELQRELDKIPSIISSPKFLENRGLGNDIGFYIFDYPPEHELQVRYFVSNMVKVLSSKMNIEHINLFEKIIEYLESRNIKEATFDMQKSEGNKSVLKALEAPLNPKKFVSNIIDENQSCDLMIFTGIGSAWPVIRAHNILNNLQPIVGDTPVIMFYPGKYDTKSLRLFNKMESEGYYRAFKLIV